MTSVGSIQINVSAVNHLSPERASLSRSMAGYLLCSGGGSLVQHITKMNHPLRPRRKLINGNAGTGAVHYS